MSCLRRQSRAATIPAIHSSYLPPDNIAMPSCTNCRKTGSRDQPKKLEREYTHPVSEFCNMLGAECKLPDRDERKFGPSLTSSPFSCGPKDKKEKAALQTNALLPVSSLQSVISTKNMKIHVVLPSAQEVGGCCFCCCYTGKYPAGGMKENIHFVLE